MNAQPAPAVKLIVVATNVGNDPVIHVEGCSAIATGLKRGYLRSDVQLDGGSTLAEATLAWWDDIVTEQFADAKHEFTGRMSKAVAAQTKADIIRQNFDAGTDVHKCATHVAYDENTPGRTRRNSPSTWVIKRTGSARVKGHRLFSRSVEGAPKGHVEFYCRCGTVYASPKSRKMNGLFLQADLNKGDVRDRHQAHLTGK